MIEWGRRLNLSTKRGWSLPSAFVIAEGNCTIKRMLGHYCKLNCLFMDFFLNLGYIRQLEMFPTRLMTTKNLKLWEIRRLFLDAVVYQCTKLYQWIIFYGSLILVLYQVPGNFCPYLKQNTRSMHFDVLQASFWLGAKKAKIQGFCDSFHGKGYILG